MLTRIQLKNFKLHADTSIDAAPITVFIGPNGSGKSSIFHSLLLWRQAATRNSNILCGGVSRHVPADGQPYLFQADQLIDIGEFDQVVRRGERELGISIRGRVPSADTSEYGPGPTNCNFEVRARENQLTYIAAEIDYEVRSVNARGTWNWSWIWPDNIAGVRSIDLPSLGFGVSIQPATTFAIFASSTAYWRQSPPPPAEKRRAAQEVSVLFAETFRRLIGSAHPVLPLRGFEEAGYPLADAPAATLDRMALQDRTVALLSVLAYNRDVERRISAWLVELANIKIEVKLLPGKRVTILCAPAHADVPGSLFSNEGTGANQLPFILVPIGLTPPGETILLSEPEVHLHPRYQTDLARLLVKLVKAERRQFFIETHSEHVLHALLNSVAKRELEVSDPCDLLLRKQKWPRSVQPTAGRRVRRSRRWLAGFLRSDARRTHGVPRGTQEQVTREAQVSA